jgi:hypothetical protein
MSLDEITLDDLSLDTMPLHDMNLDKMTRLVDFEQNGLRQNDLFK